MGEVKNGVLQAYEHNYGTNNEYRISIFVAVFLVLLILNSLFCHLVAHRWKLQFYSEAAATITMGGIAGLLFVIHSDEVTDSIMGFDPATFFVALLPPIIFNSGYTMKRRFFFDNFISILAFAILGTVISTVVIGCLLFVLGDIGLSLSMPLAECLTFGSLISATDPVSTLAIFQELRVDPQLFYIVFGESVLNDAVSIVLFSTFSKFVGYSYTSKSIAIAALDFLLIFVGSTLMGWFFGCLSSLLFKHFDLKRNLLHEVGVYVMFAYLPFLVSETLEMSGIVATLFTGITMKHYTHNNLSEESKALCANIFKVAAHFCETAVFLHLGLTLAALRHGYNLKLIFWTILTCLLSRACHVYPLSALLNCGRNRRIEANQQHMLWFSGLRGAIAFALSLSFPGPHRNAIITSTMAVVLATVFFMGGATTYMLDRLDIKRLTPMEEQQLDLVTRPARRMAILRWDARYLKPFFTVMPPLIIPEESYDRESRGIATAELVSTTSSAEGELDSETELHRNNVQDEVDSV